MSQGLFKVIFNRTLNRFVVVSELAKSAVKGSERRMATSGRFLQKICKIRPLVFGVMVVLGLVSFPIAAETLIIKADPSAPKNQQPIILQTANGLPQVNIQTSNNNGLSHNKYAKFDVAGKGAILNNSRKAVQTQQGGWVQGNPYLVRGEAKVILNEVNSSDPSVLKGYAAPEQKPPLIMDSPIPEDGRDARILPSPIPEENKDITSGGGYQPVDPEMLDNILLAKNPNYGKPFELNTFEGSTPESLERFKKYLEGSVNITTGTGKNNASKPEHVSRLDDWNKLTEGANIKDYPKDVKVAEFPDGTKAIYRPSTTGPKTIELQRSDKKTIVEVRYEKD